MSLAGVVAMVNDVLVLCSNGSALAGVAAMVDAVGGCVLNCFQQEWWQWSVMWLCIAREARL